MRLPFGIYFILGLILCIQPEHLTAYAQSRRPSTIARSLGVNPKGSATSDAFECPEEFGYYPHPSDCSQYYVCVFGGALLESCTGGLMYSHELQTCDWPRNVGCEQPSSDENVSPNGSGRDLNGRQQQHQQQQQHDAYQVVPNKFRFSSVSSTPQTERFPDSIPVRQSSVAPVTPQTYSPISNTLPPPPELRVVQPNPVITSRGQPKPLDNIDIAKLYEAHDTLPPIEEEESDRQQRVYRGQPNTVGQVQRDRDGLITQHVNALPSHGKVGSFSFGSQINQHSDIPDVVSIDITDNKIETHTPNHSDRKKRDVSADTASTTTTTTPQNRRHDDDQATSNDGNESSDNKKYDENGNDDSEIVEFGKRTVRQLRPPPPPLAPWQFADTFNIQNDPRLHSTSRAQQHAGHFQRDTELSSVNYNSFLTPPGSASRANDFYKNENTFYQLPSFKQTEYNPYGNPYGNFKTSAPNAVTTEFNSPKPYTLHTTFNVGDAQTHFKPSKLVSQAPFYPVVSNNGEPKPVIPKLQNSGAISSSSSIAGDVDSLPENFSYYHMGNGVQVKQEFNRHQSQQQSIQQVPKSVPQQPKPPIYYLDKPTKILSASTPKTHYVHISTVGGFLNNNPTAYTAINHNNNNNNNNNNKKSKIRPPNTEKYNDYTHRPVYREQAAVHENNQNNNNIYNSGNLYNVQENTDISPYYNPLISQRPTIATSIVTTQKPLFNNELAFSNFQQKSPKPLYTYEVTTDDNRSAEKSKGFYITQTVKDPNVEKFPRPAIKLQQAQDPTKNYESSNKNYNLQPQKNYETAVLIGAKKRPPIIGPQVGVNFDFNKFVYDIRESQHKPKPTPKYNAIARPVQSSDTVLIRPQNKPLSKKIQTTTPSPDDYYYDVDDDEPTTVHKQKESFATTTTVKHSTPLAVEYTTKPVKTNYINSFSVPHIISTPQYETTYKSKDPKLEEEYYEYEEDDDTSDIKMPPQNVSKFMPMSETAAPRPYLTTAKALTIVTQKPLTTLASTTAKKHSTTTFDRLHYPKNDAETTSPIPAIIKLPADNFQGARQHDQHHHHHQTDIPRYLNQSTLRPYTSRTRSKTTNLSVKPSKAPKMHIKTTSKTSSTSSKHTTQYTSETSPSTTTTTLTTTSTPKTKTFTIRAKHNNFNTAKGQQQPHSQSQSQSQSTNTNSNRWKQANKAQKAQRTNALKKNLWELDERLPNRVESSSQLPPAPESNRNYYNATSNQEYNNPTQYNSYFSVYDDEAEDTGDLYRDDYPSQYNNNRNPSQPKYVQTTYRPSTTLTTQTQPTSTKIIAPQQTYIGQSKPNYEQAPTHEAYNPEYDEALVAQLEADNEYDQPTKTQIRTNNRNRGSSHYTAGGYDDRTSSGPTANRGTHPPRQRPTLKPSGAIVSKATEFVDIYRNPPTRPEPLYPQPIPDKTAAKCRKDVCLLPDCYCGGRDIPGDLPVEDVPQIILLTFDDSVNDLNKQLYSDLFGKGRVNPNGCPISATFYVSHEWTDYSQVQNLYSDGHEMASHTVSHSFGEQFSQKKWTREVAGQREILAAYGGVKLNDVRGMRAPFLSIGGNKMFKMLYDSNFTYDSSMPVYENRPPSWPYTLDYKIFHDCMIPPCPTKSYPGVWQVPMVMWQDLNGGRCSMGDACSNPPDADGVVKMIMKNFERHYTTNRAPFGLFYHAAWFTQPHHKEGFIKFLDTINAMNDVWIVTNWQGLQWVRDPTPLSRMNSFQPFQCNYQDRPKRCNNPKVCNLWHKSGVRYMRTCQPCPEIYPWTGKSGIRSSRVDNDIDE